MNLIAIHNKTGRNKMKNVLKSYCLNLGIATKKTKRNAK